MVLWPKRFTEDGRPGQIFLLYVYIYVCKNSISYSTDFWACWTASFVLVLFGHWMHTSWALIWRWQWTLYAPSLPLDWHGLKFCCSFFSSSPSFLFYPWITWILKTNKYILYYMICLSSVTTFVKHCSFHVCTQTIIQNMSRIWIRFVIKASCTHGRDIQFSVNCHLIMWFFLWRSKRVSQVVLLFYVFF